MNMKEEKKKKKEEIAREKCERDQKREWLRIWPDVFYDKEKWVSIR